MEELKGVLQYLWPLALLMAVMLLRGYFRGAAPGAQDEALDVRAQETAEQPRPAQQPAASFAKARPELPREPEASRAPKPRDRAPDPAPLEREPIAPDAGHRLRRLLAHAEGRRVALLLHEILRPPEGCGRT